MIATDGSEPAEQAVVAGAGVARTLGTKAVLVYVRPSIGPLGEPYYQEKLSEQMEYARAALDRAEALVQEEGCHAEAEILEGGPGEQIVDLARNRNDRPGRANALLPIVGTPGESSSAA